MSTAFTFHADGAWEVGKNSCKSAAVNGYDSGGVKDEHLQDWVGACAASTVEVYPWPDEVVCDGKDDSSGDSSESDAEVVSHDLIGMQRCSQMLCQALKDRQYMVDHGATVLQLEEFDEALGKVVACAKKEVGNYALGL